jgi:hypothetical protein
MLIPQLNINPASLGLTLRLAISLSSDLVALASGDVQHWGDMIG